MRLLRVGGGLFLVLLIALAVLLALDIGTWHDSLRSGDARYRVSPAAARWQASSVVPLGAARRTLEVGDDLAVRRAIRLFRLTYGVKGRLDTALQRQGVRALAELALADVARGRDQRRAAQASDLLGVLAFGDFAGGGRDASQAERAVSAFVNAVRLDPSDEAAKFNLELALRLFEARGIRVGANPGGKGAGRQGGGTGTPGTGY
jgi:hypothetical protein